MQKLQLSNGGAISGATTAEKCQQASLRIQRWLRFRRLECQHGEPLCSTVALYSYDSCAAFVLWRLQIHDSVKLNSQAGQGHKSRAHAAVVPNQDRVGSLGDQDRKHVLLLQN